MSADDGTTVYATQDGVRTAIEGLSQAALLRVQRAASLLRIGSEYTDPVELLNEAIARTMSAAAGGRGRRWPLRVSFDAYLIETMRGLASDSRSSVAQARTDHLEVMAGEDGDAEQVLGTLQVHHDDPLTGILEREDADERERAAADDVRSIEEYFSADEEVNWIIMGEKDGLPPAEIRSLGDMTQTQYESARKRFRRGLEKLFPGRSRK